MRFYNYRKEIGDALDSNITNGRFRMIAKAVTRTEVDQSTKLVPEGILDVNNYILDDKKKYFVAKDLVAFLKGLDRINTIKDHTKAIDGSSFDEIEVPSFVKDLINPTAVYLDPANQLCIDLLDYSNDDKTEAVDWADFKRACLRLCARIRQGKSWTYIKLSEALKVAALTDVYQRSIIKGAIHFDNKYDVVPYDLIDVSALISDEYFYLSEKAYIDKFITYTLVPLLRDSAN